MKTVYLAGLISTKAPESLAWRSEAALALIGAGFHVSDPLRDKPNLTQCSPDGGLTTPELTAKDIILRDYHDIERADVVLVNLNDYGDPRAFGGSTGTMFEIAWCWLLRKPVVAFCDLGPNGIIMRRHPFLVEAVSHIFETWQGAVGFVKHYHGDKRV